ncbi:CrcB family protein [Cyanobium sp. FGCU-6]|nr:CrcB family protein [Cyanobium sp. FGCU6]
MGQARPPQPTSPRGAAALLLVAAGAVPGALLRWRLGDLLAVNLLGSLLIGLLVAVGGRYPRIVLLGGVGFCGSLTSYSTWVLELEQALRSGGAAAAAGVLAAVPAGLGAAAVGLAIGRLLTGLHRRGFGARFRR